MMLMMMIIIVIIIITITIIIIEYNRNNDDNNDNNNHNNNHHTIQSPKKNPRWDPVASETSVENSENSSLRHAGDQLVVLVCRLGGHLHRPVFLVLAILIIFAKNGG